MTAEDVWFFGYGSLMWRPGFTYRRVVPARLFGYHRALCVYSWHYRGTRERPGLVLGLDRGGSCLGHGFAVAGEDESAVLDYLDGRELVTDVYIRKRLRLVLEDRQVPAWCYVARRDHEQYAGRVHLSRLLELVRQGTGIGGPCRDYVLNTVEHLEGMGIVDGPLHAIAAHLRPA